MAQVNPSSKTAHVLRIIARYGSLILGVGVFIFALIMGAQDYGGGVNGLVKNLPNTLPWFVLLVFVLLAWRQELLGGTLVTLLGIGLVYYFNFSGPNFWWFTFFLTLSFPVLGACFLVSWYLRKKSTN